MIKVKEKRFQILLVQSAANDVAVQVSRNDPEEIQNARNKVVLAAKSTFNSVEKIMKTSNLQKAVLMKQLPRFDPISHDPYALRAALAMLYNSTLAESWLKSDLSNKIFLGDHSLDCSGSVRDSRYRETRTGRFDGVHLLGSSGFKALTHSILNIHETAQATSNVYNSRIAAARRRHSLNPKSPFRNPDFLLARLKNNKNSTPIQLKNRFDILGQTQGN